MPFVLDCSVALAWLLPDESNEAVDGLIDQLASDVAYVPSIWSLEVTNALLVAERRGRISGVEAEALAGSLQALPIEVDAGAGLPDLTESILLARKLGLTTYDAAYVELAKRRGLPLATLDKRLRAAASEAAVALLPHP